VSGLVLCNFVRFDYTHFRPFGEEVRSISHDQTFAGSISTGVTKSSSEGSESSN
jgi:hypothetical protein